jgi:alpha-tubulin suppressor-like RCC1 family protein
VAGLANVRSVAAGGYHSLAALDSGAVRSWGWNGVGQLGTGTTADSLRPTPAATSGKTEVAAGAAHSLSR